MSYKEEVLDKTPFDELTFRVAHEDDALARADVARLAALDSARAPAAPYVIACLDGRPVAARSMLTGDTVADPFVRTADIVPMLAMRAAQLHLPARVALVRARRRRLGLRAT